MASTVRPVDEPTLAYRAEIARRLKAGRWLAGTQIDETGKGRVGRAVRALSVVELAGLPVLRDNEITASMLGTIERMERHTTPNQLQSIAEGLGLGDDWFEPALSLLVRDHQEQAAAHLATLAEPDGASPGDRPEEVPARRRRTGTRP